ncbi:MAG TPA: hypothetical protein DEQ26_04555, partial [Flavobacteriaceae bacterium]|nr:hypothetical protein [Flavobacteriaceae bacterium]
MTYNRIESIFNLLSDEAFKDPNTGLLFFPAYIYTYDPKDEYQIREEINILNNQLKRPSNSLNCFVINIYQEFISYLLDQKFAGKSLIDEIFELEKNEPE